MNYVGIDPGASGAVAVMWGNTIGGYHVEITDWNPKCWTALPTEVWNTAYMIEKVHAMPKQGVTSMFSFGVNFGWWLGVLDATAGDYDMVTPQRWKKHFGLLGKDKEAARLLAIEMFPLSANLLKLKKHHNRAEALLLAEYSRSRHRNIER